MFPSLEFLFFDHQDQDISKTTTPANSVSEKASSETVWKLPTYSISWPHEPAERGEKAHFWALRATKNV